VVEENFELESVCWGPWIMTINAIPFPVIIGAGPRKGANRK